MRRSFFQGSPAREITRSVGGGITGIKVGIAYAETLKLALELHPSTQRVFVVAKGIGRSRRSSLFEPSSAAFRGR